MVGWRDRGRKARKEGRRNKRDGWPSVRAVIYRSAVKLSGNEQILD